MISPVGATPTIVTPLQAQVQRASQEAFQRMFTVLLNQYVAQGMERNAAAAQVRTLHSDGGDLGHAYVYIRTYPF